MTKWCGGCCKFRQETDFNVSKSRLDGLQTQCRDCSKAWYEANKVRHTERVYARRAVRRTANKDRIRAYLETHPCVDCGEADPVVLEFDHVRGRKVREISGMVFAPERWSVIQDEIKKCEVRCANCHRRRHNQPT